MKTATSPAQRSAVSASFTAFRRRLGVIALLSGAVNILMLNGSVYMLQVYDRVLVSGSLATLASLTAVLVGVFVLQAVLDGIRQRLVVRAAGLFEVNVRGPVHEAFLRLAVGSRDPRAALQPTRDVDQIRTFLTGQGPGAILDLPWVPIFMLVGFLIHPWIGYLTLGGVVVLTALTFASERFSRSAAKTLVAAQARQTATLEATLRNAESAVAMGLGASLAHRWIAGARELADANERNADLVGGFGVASRTARMLLQSIIYGIGAYLVIAGEMSGGAMVAASIMVGRALAPIDQVIANWRGFVQSREAAARLKKTLDALPPPPATELPVPHRSLTVENLVVGPLGAEKPVLAGLNFSLSAGDVVGVIGPSGAGKTSLARTLVGIWPPLKGSVRLDGATLDQWGAERLGPRIGFVSQQVGLFEGTLAENIARFEPDAPADRIIAAASAAGIHDFVLQQPEGYDTRISPFAGALSAGQRQRIAIARALYGDPFLIVLDEANSNLDANGDGAMLKAILGAKERGAIVVLVTHREQSLQVCNKILALGEGRQLAFGPREEVFRPRPAVPHPAARPAAASVN